MHPFKVSFSDASNHRFGALEDFGPDDLTTCIQVVVLSSCCLRLLAFRPFTCSCSFWLLAFRRLSDPTIVLWESLTITLFFFPLTWTSFDLRTCGWGCEIWLISPASPWSWKCPLLWAWWIPWHGNWKGHIPPHGHKTKGSVTYVEGLSANRLQESIFALRTDTTMAIWTNKVEFTQLQLVLCRCGYRHRVRLSSPLSHIGWG